MPAERIGALIGKNGRIKRGIETKTKTTISVRGSEVVISGDAYNSWIAKSIVEAIAIGFDYNKAVCLMNDNYTMEVIPLHAKGSRKECIKGRIIGKGGATKDIIEKTGNCFISVFDDVVGVIGEYDDVANTAYAINMLISGSSHGAAYNYLERKRSERKNTFFGCDWEYRNKE